jgi:hypothetical protein
MNPEHSWFFLGGGLFGTIDLRTPRFPILETSGSLEEESDMISLVFQTLFNSVVSNCPLDLTKPGEFGYSTGGWGWVGETMTLLPSSGRGGHCAANLRLQTLVTKNDSTNINHRGRRPTGKSKRLLGGP